MPPQSWNSREIVRLHLLPWVDWAWRVIFLPGPHSCWQINLNLPMNANPPMNPCCETVGSVMRAPCVFLGMLSIFPDSHKIRQTGEGLLMRGSTSQVLGTNHNPDTKPFWENDRAKVLSKDHHKGISQINMYMFFVVSGLLEQHLVSFSRIRTGGILWN